MQTDLEGIAATECAGGVQPGRSLAAIGRAPSYKGLRPASEVSSRVKRRNRRADTIPEVLLRRQLWHMGFRFRKNVKQLPGKPDIVFHKASVVVFCDGDFWHGRDWSARKAKLEHGANPEYWTAKIASNVERDQANTRTLVDAGWQVVRLWETDIKADPQAAAEQVAALLQTSSRGS